jgi:hypothetical protein
MPYLFEIELGRTSLGARLFSCMLGTGMYLLFNGETDLFRVFLDDFFLVGVIFLGINSLAFIA